MRQLNLHTFFSPVLLLAMVMLAMDHSHRPVAAFELRHKVFSNTTKNRLMMPLRLDEVVLNSRRVTKTDIDGEVVRSSPRGIVLNSVVGGLTFAGGLMGFVTKGSKASLTAGSIFGGLLMLSALIISNDSSSKSAKGNILGFSVSGMLCFVMGKKFLVSKKFMPAGLLASLSAAGSVYNLIETIILYLSKRTGTKTNDETSSIDVGENSSAE